MPCLTLQPLEIPSFLMQDNARLVENFLEAETVLHMEWPASSHYLNPIEHVWDTLVRHQSKPPVTLKDLEIVLLPEGNSIPQKSHR